MEDYTGMTRNELDEILKAHKKWVKNEKGGRHADFRGADLGGTTGLLEENQSMRNADDVSPVRHGRWEVVKGVFTPGGDPLLRCPLCKAKESEHLCGVESRVDWNYCPNCGAKMDGQ